MNITENLRGKNVLLTGGGSGMGKATALALANNGANVAIAGRNKENLASTVSLAQATEKISTKEADVTDRYSLEDLFQWFDVEFGTLDY
ncbi:MAG: SDR family oxidoreductase, partial [Opitutae bacterium]|nr:SDR family oxidoreductase [Opitutae bacterium]